MSYFNGATLRRLRESRGLSMDTVYDLTGVSPPTISKIENGRIDPRMSTVTRLLTCYNAGLGELESESTEPVSLADLKEQGARNAEKLSGAGFTPSDPWARLDRKEAAGGDTRAERQALATRT